MSWLLHSLAARNPAAHPPGLPGRVGHGRIRGARQPARHRRPGRRRARAADRVWVALSPWFITLQYGGSNATAVDLISGLAVAAVGAFALASPRGFSGLQLGSLLLGIWLIISPPILDHKHPIAHAMYWSNSFSGGVLIALAAAGLGFAALRRTAR